MEQIILAREAAIRLSVFLLILAVLIAWERLRPRRALVANRPRRWFTNLAIAVLDTVVVRLLFPAAAVGAAFDAAQAGWGLFHHLDWPLWLEILLAVIALDGLIYGQHVASHRIPLLWRLHRVHHSDRDIDVTTAVRFHPIEIALSMLLKFAAIYALGAHAVAVILFEVLLNGVAMFNHANIRLGAADHWLRFLIVTPDMHRVHHSILPDETDSNYGFNLPWWDWLFGTYRPQPKHGHEGMTIGLREYQTVAPTQLGWSLWLPFRR